MRGLAQRTEARQAEDELGQACSWDHQNSLCDADVLRLGEKAQRFFTAFAPDAACFHATEWDAQVAHEPAIYPNRAGVNALGHAVSPVQVLRPNAGGKAVFDVVGIANYFFFVVEGRDGDDRTENFLAIGATR